MSGNDNGRPHEVALQNRLKCQTYTERKFIHINRSGSFEWPVHFFLAKFIEAVRNSVLNNKINNRSGDFRASGNIVNERGNDSGSGTFNNFRYSPIPEFMSFKNLLVFVCTT